MVGCTNQQKTKINTTYAMGAQVEARKLMVLLMFPQHERSSLVVLSWLFLLLMGDNGGDSSNKTMSGVTKTVVGSNNTGSNNTGSNNSVGSNDRGVVDDMVGGVGGSPPC